MTNKKINDVKLNSCYLDLLYCVSVPKYLKSLHRSSIRTKLRPEVIEEPENVLNRRGRFAKPTITDTSRLLQVAEDVTVVIVEQRYLQNPVSLRITTWLKYIVSIKPI